MLTLSPLVAAICGGNAAVIKPSEMAAATANVIARLIPKYLDRDAFSVLLGAAPETTALLEQPWDHIFFTDGTTPLRTLASPLGRDFEQLPHIINDLRFCHRCSTMLGTWTTCARSRYKPDADSDAQVCTWTPENVDP